MKHATAISASLAAILSSIATIGCCLPFGFAAAVGAGAAGAVFTSLRPWLLGLSVAFLALGFWQLRRATLCDLRSKLIARFLLWSAVIVVVAVFLFPQQIAALIADRWFGAPK